MLRTRLLVLLLACVGAAAARADGLHPLWELHGKHNTVFLLGSIHVLRPSDYPLAPVVLQAYGSAKSVFMEINLAEARERPIARGPDPAGRLGQGALRPG